MLGQLPGFVSTGEFALLGPHCIVDNRLCGCGRRFRECPYWQAVGREAFGGWDGSEATELTTLYRQVARQRYIPMIVAPWLSQNFTRRKRRYQVLLGKLYSAVARVSGAEIVVDCSKSPAYALVLRGCPGVDLRIINLVRDSRGVAYSNSKQGVMRDSVDRVVPRTRFSAPNITLVWIVYQLLFDCIRVTGIPVTAARYEDVVRAPRESLLRLAAFAGRPPELHDLDFITPPAVDMREDHTSVGNDSRLTQGTLTLREDDAWRTRLPAQSRRIVTLMSWPLLKRWRYV